MKKRLDVEVAACPTPPEITIIERWLAKWLGAKPPIYGMNVKEPVFLVEPTDGLSPGFYWPIDLDAYRKE